MIIAQATREIHAPYEDVWALISDVTTVAEYHPQVDTVDLLSSNKEGVGATRVCHFHDGTSVKEVVTEADDEHIKFALSEFSLPMKEFCAEIIADPTLSNGVTELTFVLYYTVKYGPLGYVLGVALMKPQMKKLVNSVLAGVDNRLATGKPIQKNLRQGRRQ